VPVVVAVVAAVCWRRKKEEEEAPPPNLEAIEELMLPMEPCLKTECGAAPVVVVAAVPMAVVVVGSASAGVVS
jgi:hypothetical protein